MPALPFEESQRDLIMIGWTMQAVLIVAQKFRLINRLPRGGYK